MSNIKYVGVNDHISDLFEGQFHIPNGIAYNSYAIIDEKIAIMDSVDVRFFDEWLSSIKLAIGDREPDYLVIHHMEPDHSSSIARFMAHFKNTIIVSSQKAFNMIDGFFGTDFKDRQLTINEGSTLSLGKRTLTFYTAPMVHWPEVMVSYLSTGELFSADSFGKFGALDINEDWACEARRYYFGIVGKYGAQVQSLLRKLAPLDIKAIYPLHGPVLSENLDYYLNLYDIWSSYKPECEGVFIPYTSVYGNTKNAVMLLKDELARLGCPRVSVCDLAREDMHEAIEDAFKYDKIVFATTTYNGGVFPFMREFITHLTDRGFKNRTVAFIENGSWAPMATKTMLKLFEGSSLTILDTGVKIMSSLNEESAMQIKELAKALI